ncbi:MAG: hypothetical protein K2Q32_00910 [Alphaproteobacteria bacterium]|nr:hypothetical protein [Alphaproteobacteria bacterium]
MKLLFALIILFSFQTNFAAAYQQSNGEIRYNPKERFAMPANKSNGLKAATNVVIKEVEFNQLPEFIQNQADFIAGDCTKSGENKKYIKYYRYVSDLTRDGGFSGNYLADLSGLADKPQQACMVDSACNKDGCMLVGYLSTAYEKWERQFFVRNKSWKYTHVENQAAKTTLTVLDFTQECPKSSAETGDKCLTRHLWLESGLKEYNPNAVDSFFQQLPEEVTEPVQEQPAVEEGVPAEAAPAEAAPEAPPAQ